MRHERGRARGRDRHIAAVAALGEPGNCSRLTLLGDAGIGKTRIVEEALRGLPHVRGNGVPSMSWSPYFALQTAVRAELVGEPEDVAEQILGRIDGRVLWIDDLHWTSTATVMTLDLLAGRVPIVVTARTQELPAIHQQSVRSTTNIIVRPLDTRTARQVALDHWPELTHVRLDDVVALAGGNPLLLTTLPDIDGSVAVDLTDAVSQMLLRETPADRDALGRLAVIGRPFPADALDLQPAERGAKTGSALDRMLVDDRDGTWFRHPAFHELVLDSLQHDLPRLHAEVADLVGEQERAAHLLAAGRAQEALDLARRLTEAAATATERARHLGVAIAAADQLGQEVETLRVDAVEAFVAAQRFDDALAMNATVDADDPSRLAAAGFYAARAHWFRGEVDLAETTLADAIVHAERADAPMRPLIRAERAYLLLRHGRPGAVEEAEKAAAEAEETGTGSLRARAVLAVARGYRLQPGWEDDLRFTAAEARRDGDVEMEFAAMFSLGSGLGLIGRLREGNEIHLEGAERARRAGRTTWLSHFETARLLNLAMMGGSQTEIVETTASILTDRPRFRNWPQLYAARLLALADLGRDVDAATVAAEGRALAVSNEEKTWVAVATAHVAWMARDPERLASSVDLARSAGDAFRGLRMTAELDALHLALEQTHIDAYASMPQPDTPAEILPNLWSAVFEVEAFAALRAGEVSRAADRFGAAADSWQGIEMVRYAVRARWAQSEALAATGDRRRAAVRDAALDLARRHGLAAHLQRWDQPAIAGITRREMEALRHVGRGLTSVEIAEHMALSPSTVDSYVASARRKLGARTRAEAALMVTPQGDAR